MEVYVPDYIPHAPPADMLNNIADLYPGEKKRGWLASAWASLGVLKLLPYIKGILYDAQGLVDKVSSGRCAEGEVAERWKGRELGGL